MKRDPIGELRAMLFGEAPYERQFAPDLATLVDLAPVLEGAMLLQVVDEFSHMGAFPQERYRSLAGLLAHYPESGGERVLGTMVNRDPWSVQIIPEVLIQRTVDGLRTVEPHIGYRARAILALAARLPEGQRNALLQEEALLAANEPDWAYTQHRAIIELAGAMDAVLPKEAADKLINIVRDLEGTDYTIRGAAALAPVLPQPLGNQVLTEVLEVIRAQDNLVLQAEALLSLGSRLSGAQGGELLAEATQVARAIDLGASGRMDLLVRLSLYFPEPTRSQILEEATRPYTEGIWRWPSADEALVEAFVRLAPDLPRQLAEAFRAQVQSLAIPPDFEKLQPLIPYLSEEGLTAALETIPTLGWDDARVEAIIALAPHLPASLLPRALEMVAGFEEEKAVAQALIVLAPHLSPALFGAAAEIAEEVQSDWWRGRGAEALRKLPDLTESAHPVLATPSPGERLRLLWRPLPREVQQGILSDVMNRVWDFYGGSQTAMVPDDTAPEPLDGFEIAMAEETGDDDTDRWFDGGYAYYEPDETGVEPQAEPAIDWESEEVYEDLGDAADAAGDDWDGLDTEMAYEEEYDVEELLAEAHIPEQDRKPVVNTGFAPQESPDDEIPRTSPLLQDYAYYFWLNIGGQKRTAIAAESPVLDVSVLPPEAVLQVVLYSFPGEIEIIPGADIGEVKILSNRRGVVTQPVVEPGDLVDQDRIKDHLYFPVKTPSIIGDSRLRCNLYYQGVLVQSHLITARVVSGAAFNTQDEYDSSIDLPLRHTLDYKLTHSLRTEILADLGAHSLSILLNDDGDGTHGFRFFGGEEAGVVKEQASFTGLELQDMIEQARGAMRKASWGSGDEWTPSAPYRYEKVAAGVDADRLLGDLVRFAKWGTRFYRQTLQKIAEANAGDLDEADQSKARLEALLRNPGSLQIAAKEDSRHVLPAAMIYDYPIHDALPGGMYRLCDECHTALTMGTSLERTRCFQGNCLSKGDLTTVCPSGFWGYRHDIGMPVSIGGEASEDGQAAETDLKILYSGAPKVSVAVSLDDDFKLRDEHIDDLRGLRAGPRWVIGDEGQEILDLLRDEGAHLVYFYCHGGLTSEGVPYLQVGPQDDVWGIITPSLLPNLQIKWQQPKPLVFINGCHTTALEPAKSLDLVTSFIKEARAVGVIGTEITIFEPLATAFAEACLGYFLDGEPIGKAIRLARLKLLQDGNPLGLVYIPYAVSSLALVEETGNGN